MDWSDIIGQETAVGRLRQMLQRDQIPHALLFSGPAQVGKRLAADRLAAALLCATSRTDPCGQCPSCGRLARQEHPDLLLVEPEGENIRIGQIRQLQEEAALAAYEGGRRVVIIDGAEKMNVPAMNSLLKFIEEPPAGVFILLLTPARHMLLATLLSRCAEIPFHRMGVAVLADALIRRGIAPAQADTAARLSGGRFGAALASLDQERVQWREEAEQWLQDLMAGQGALALAAGLAARERKEVLAFLDALQLRLRDRMIWSVTGEERLLLSAAAATKTPGNGTTWLEALHIVKEVRRAIQGNANLRLLLETLALRLGACIREESKYG